MSHLCTGRNPLPQATEQVQPGTGRWGRWMLLPSPRTRGNRRNTTVAQGSKRCELIEQWNTGTHLKHRRFTSKSALEPNHWQLVLPRQSAKDNGFWTIHCVAATRILRQGALQAMDWSSQESLTKNRMEPELDRDHLLIEIVQDFQGITKL